MSEKSTLTALDPAASARMAGLRYVNDDRPGIQRERAGEDFRYLDAQGGVIKNPETLERIKSLAIPPAWTEVWICPAENGHLQATGRDARGRKQHRYHSRWREVREETKYAQMTAFAETLPAIRKRVKADMALPDLPQNKVLATVVRLLEVSLIRVGNEEYARTNHSYGVTTMRNRHVEVSGSKLRFHFRGKSGKDHEVQVHDRRLAKLVKACQDLPGQELFQYVDESGERRKVESEDVNAYLREITGQEFTAKYFRTWAGTVLAAEALQEFKHFDSETEAKSNVVQAVKAVSKRLGNTPTICRKCYVHPVIFEAYLDGSLAGILEQKGRITESSHELRPEEASVLALLKRRLAINAKATPVPARKRGRKARRSPDAPPR